MNTLKTLGLFGGTFDPIHNGHLRMALEWKQQLGLDEMRLLPCHQPPHRDKPGRSSEDRAAMVRLAVEECSELTVDERELRRDKPSYTVETLQEIRQEVGADVSLCWCVGMDSLVTLNQWYRWRDLLGLAHLVVAARPGWGLPLTGEIPDWVAEHKMAAEELHLKPHGGVVVTEQSLLDISATEIRHIISVGQPPEFLLPSAVWHYIEKAKLYQDPGVGS